MRVRRVLDLYAAGTGSPSIEKQLGIAKATVTQDLHMIEKHGGIRVMRQTARPRPAQVGVVRATREDGIRRASVRDFHSFRVTWITLALTAGMPIELVQRVTGHKTTDVVLKHYFRPGREAFRTAVLNALPDLASVNALPAGQQTPAPCDAGQLLDTALEDLQQVRSRTPALHSAISLIQNARRQLDGDQAPLQ